MSDAPVIEPLPPDGPRRFPGYDVLSQTDSWDGTTLRAIQQRMAAGDEPLRFFTADEASVADALFDELLCQHSDPRVPVLALVDARLAEGKTDGWRYADMPEDGEAFRRTLAGLEADARQRFAARFAELSSGQRGELIQAVQDRDEPWHGLKPSHVWSLWTRYALSAFYSHPWALNEIGFGGPAYPRGYRVGGLDRREPDEVADAGPLAGPHPPWPAESAVPRQDFGHFPRKPR